MTTTICIDTGGTFTDGFVVHDGTPHVVKVMTTPHDLEVCFRDVIDAAAEAIGIDVPKMLRDTESVRYATTVGTNAVLQRRGPKLGLLTDAPSVNGDAGKSGVGVFVDAEMVAQVDGEIPSAAMRDLLERGARGLVSSLNDASREQAARDLFEDTYPPHCLDAVPLVLGRQLEHIPGRQAIRVGEGLIRRYAEVGNDAGAFPVGPRDRAHRTRHRHTRLELLVQLEPLARVRPAARSLAQERRLGE